MFIMKSENYNKQYALYAIANAETQTVFVTIDRLPDALKLTGYDFKDDVFYFNLIAIDCDRLKLANQAVAQFPQFEPIIRRLVDSWQDRRSATRRPVRCIDTGEVFASMYAACQAHDLTYSALFSHVSGMKGHKTVKGRRYERI